MELIGFILVAAVIIVAAVVAYSAVKSQIVRIVVWEYEKGIRYENGTCTDIVGPGVYWLLCWKSHITKIDIRPEQVILAGQEVLSADGVGLKVSIAARFQVTDPQTAINKAQNYYQEVYLILQLAVREIIGSKPIDELLEHRSGFDSVLTEMCASKVEELGLALLSAGIRDIMFPGDLKRVFAQVVEARKEGLAALEKARGETAALRNLANAAKMLESNPALMQLRMLQTLGESSGNTIVVGIPSDQMLPVIGKGKVKADSDD